jgi:uncharacterized membrane protein
LLRPLHPLHAILLAGALPLALGALLGDITYSRSFETQWKNFASWLVVAALMLNAVVAVWALIDFVRLRSDRGAPRIAYLVLVIAASILGLVNALVHAGDGWQSMPAGAYLSGLVSILLLAATWLGFSNYRARVPA